MEPAAEAAMFENHRDALFLRRPNRFLVVALDETTGEELTCHCPNPGRIEEFTLPGTRLILERRDTPGTTSWTMVAVRYGDGVVPLYSARANGVARSLVLPRMFPDAILVRPEYRIGRSRFDFFVQDSRGGRHLVEVKACSLVERGVAMFPDAPSLRAARHLEELAAMAPDGWTCHVLFLIMHGRPGVFIPNLHADPGFARAAGRFAPLLDLRAIALEASEAGTVRVVREHVPVELGHTELAAADRGNYLVLLHVPAEYAAGVGSLGDLRFPPGWYVYAGSAGRGLDARIARHLRRAGKKLHWHIDHLRPGAESVRGLRIASYDNLECELAAALGGIGGEPVPGFGSSDCRCGGHLYRFDADPMRFRPFLDALFRARHERALVRR